jgi:hypothetical protein
MTLSDSDNLIINFILAFAPYTIGRLEYSILFGAVYSNQLRHTP